ncbi:MAG: hypothetical protein Q8P05_04715 [Candidatus Diapherotrites archaeon]|nr:hypothetical protein [Candidatus Diapherotrites archaeon]
MRAPAFGEKKEVGRGLFGDRKLFLLFYPHELAPIKPNRMLAQYAATFKQYQ